MNHMRINKPSPLSRKTLNLSTFFCLYIAQAIPMSFFSTAIQVLMRQADYSLSSIALLQLIKLPWILKFLWAPLVDRHCITLKDYKRCIITSEIVYALLILLVGLLDIQTDLYLIIGLVFLSLIASATQDIATDTLAVLSFGKSDKSLVNSMQSMGSFGGTLIGTGMYALVNLRISINKGCFTWEAWSKNLTNTDYLSYYFVTSKAYAQKGKPITLGTSVSISL